MKRSLLLAFTLAMVLLTAAFMSSCMFPFKLPINPKDSSSTPNSEEQSGGQSSDSTNNSAGTSPKTEPAALAAYYQKYQELVAKYGEIKLTDKPNKDSYGGASYLGGVCVVDLIDFNGDGASELFVVYSNGHNTGRNVDDVAIPQAMTYEIEVWTYADNQLKQLLHKDSVSGFQSFMSEYWNSDNCFVTVLQKGTGLPVIQLYQDDAIEGYYINLYVSKNKFVEDKLTFDTASQSFASNGKSITEDVWDKNVSGYDKILCCGYLSSDEATSSDLSSSWGVNYNDTINQTKQVVKDLSKSKESTFKIVSGDYVSLYLRELDKTTRDRLAADSTDFPYDYALYDIDQNGTPELIIKTGNCEAAYWFQVYTVVGGKLVDCKGISGSESSLYVGTAKGMIRYYGHMGAYNVTKVDLNGTKLSTKEIASGETDIDYPTLESLGYENLNQYLGLCYGTTPANLYQYH